MERGTTSEVGDTQHDGEWWLGSNSKEDGSSLLLIVLFQSVILCDLFIFETSVIVTLYYLFSKPMWLLHYITLL